MSTLRPGKQRLIEVCYCSPNLKADQCDYCHAKHEVSMILDTADSIQEFLDNEDAVQHEIDETLNFYQISSKGRLTIMFQLEELEFEKL